jgi:Domain of unknown function (DUF6766)
VRFLRENGLSIFFLAIFLVTLVGQALVGHGLFNQDQLLHHGDPISLGRYLTTSEFAADVAENWQSEYLQFTLYILGTVWLLQRGSPESKKLDQGGLESEEEQRIGRHASARSPRWAKVGGLRTAIYSNSLVLVMTALWLGSWFAQSIAGWSAYNADQLDHQAATVDWLGYLGTNDFWDRTLQNWQSEFLAVGSMAILSVYLRQRGSAESKPVGAPHDATGVEG